MRSQILYYASEERRAALSAELSGWRGTRFWPRVARKGERADCIRFSVSVHQATGAFRQAVEWPRYSARKWPGALEAIVAGYLFQGNWETLAPARVAAGDVVIARLDDGSIHAGVVESPRVAWHCFPGSGVTVCHPSNHHLVAILRAYEH